MQVINLDLSVKGIIPLLQAKQGDVGRKFQAVITDGGTAYEIPTGTTLSVWYSGTSGEGNYSEIGLDDDFLRSRSAFTISGNTVTVELVAQMLSCAGGGTMCLVMNSAEGEQIATWNIPYIVEKIPGANSEGAKQYYTAYAQAAMREMSSALVAALEDAKQSGEFDGPRGIQGEKGDPPVRGVDYWTDEDKQEIVDDVLGALPVAEKKNTLSGTWRFNDVPTAQNGDDWTEEINFYIDYSNPEIAEDVTVRFYFSNMRLMWYHYDLDSNWLMCALTKIEPSEVEVNGNVYNVADFFDLEVPGNFQAYKNGWSDPFTKPITFTSEQEVSPEFYAWFTANASYVGTSEYAPIYASGIEDLRTSLMAVFNSMADRSSKRFEVHPFNTDQFPIPSNYLILNKKVVCEFHKFDANNGTLTIESCDENGTYMQKASVFNGVLTPFEWINPPLTPWIMYRTTDRFMGKPVGKCIVEVTLPSTSDSVSYDMQSFILGGAEMGVSTLIGAVATNGYCVAPYSSGYTNSNFELSADFNTVTIKYDKAKYGGWKCQILLAYTVYG